MVIEMRNQHIVSFIRTKFEANIEENKNQQNKVQLSCKIMGQRTYKTEIIAYDGTFMKKHRQLGHHLITNS